MFRKTKHIAHLTSVHPRNDIRVFMKECRSLAKAGYSVSLVVADGKGFENRDGIAIYDVGAASGRIDRVINASRRVYFLAAELNADIYHFHDPELIPVGLKLKKRGMKVIFDAHEDVPKQFYGKHYLNRPLRWLISKALSFYEVWACRRLDAIVTATPFIRDKYLTINPMTVDINNFPILGEFDSGIDWQEKERHVSYVGAIAGLRGIREVVMAMAKVKSGARLQLVGTFPEPFLESEVKSYDGWSRVDALGYLERSAVRTVLAKSVAGLVTFLPLPNNVDAQPNKMFEYMSAGIPVIASHFPLWREIIEGNDCGLCIDPAKPDEIAEAIDFLVNHSDRAKQMGENGRLAVLDRYNWPLEEKKLIKLYDSLL